MTWLQTLLDGLVAGAIGGAVTLWGVRIALRHDRRMAQRARITDAISATMTRLADTPNWRSLDTPRERKQFSVGVLRDLILVDGLASGSAPQLSQVMQQAQASWAEVEEGNEDALGNFGGSLMEIFRYWLQEPDEFERKPPVWADILAA